MFSRSCLDPGQPAQFQHFHLEDFLKTQKRFEAKHFADQYINFMYCFNLHITLPLTCESRPKGQVSIPQPPLVRSPCSSLGLPAEENWIIQKVLLINCVYMGSSPHMTPSLACTHQHLYKPSPLWLPRTKTRCQGHRKGESQKQEVRTEICLTCPCLSPPEWCWRLQFRRLSPTERAGKTSEKSKGFL